MMPFACFSRHFLTSTARNTGAVNNATRQPESLVIIERPMDSAISRMFFMVGRRYQRIVYSTDVMKKNSISASLLTREES